MMSFGTIPASYIHSLVELSWPEIIWAHERNLIGWRDVVEFARTNLERGSIQPIDLELSEVGKESAGQISEIVHGAMDSRLPTDDKTASAKWLYLVLKWLYENRAKFDNPLELVEEVYSYFQYPDEIISFVAYMPPLDGYDPSKHSDIDNLDRLYENWKLYLTNFQV